MLRFLRVDFGFLNGVGQQWSNPKFKTELSGKVIT